MSVSNLRENIKARQHGSEPNITAVPKIARSLLFPHQSLPNILDNEEKFTAEEYLYASEILESIVSEGSAGFFAGNMLKRLKLDGVDSGKTLNTQIIFKMIYGAMKCTRRPRILSKTRLNIRNEADLSYIDTILVKTQFLVYHNEVRSPNRVWSHWRASVSNRSCSSYLFYQW